MEVGKLYKTKHFYWMLYRSEDDTDMFCSASAYHSIARYWSTRSQNLPYIPPNSLFVLLEQKQKYCKVLSPEGNVGWIHLDNWCRYDIMEVNVE